MGRNLTNLYISQSFEFLVQISGSELQNGLGSTLTGSLLITSSKADTATSASFATTASYVASVVSASYAVSSSFSSTSTSASYASSALSSSYAVTASYALNGGGGSTNTGSLLVTASATANVITFTKGDGSTFPVTVATGSAVSASYATTASLALNNVVTSSTTNATITFTKGDGTTYDNVINNVVNATSASIAVSASAAISASRATSAATADTATTASYVLNAVSASYAVSASQAQTAISSSYAISASQAQNAVSASYYGGTVVSASYAVSASQAQNAVSASVANTATSSSYAVSASQAQNAISSSYAVTASFALNTNLSTGSLLTTASAVGNVVTFTKGDGSTFPVTVATGSAATGPEYGFQGLYSGSNVPLFTFSDTSSATGIPIFFTASDGTPIQIYDQAYNSGSIYASYNLGFKTAQYANDNRGGQGNLIFGGYNHRVTNGGGFGVSLSPQAMTMLGGRENVFGVGSAGIGWVMIGGYSNNLGNTDGSGQAEDGPVLIGGRYNSLGASTGGGIFAGYENTQRSNTDASVIIGGKQNNLAADCQFGAIVGASNSTLNSGYCGIFGGYYNVQAGSYNCYIYGGQENNIQANSYNNNSIVGGQNNTIQAITDTNNPVGRFEPGTSIIGGRFNTISGSTHFSQIIGGNNNLMTHSGSVILGGSNITSSAHNTVYTPNLDVTGSAKITGSVYIDAATQAFAISGSLGSSEMFVIDYHTNGARFLSNRSNSVLHLGTPNKTDILSLGRNAAVGFYGDAFEPGTVYSFASDNAVWKNVNFTLSGSLTITGSQVITGSLTGDVKTLTISSQTASLDCSLGNFFNITLPSSSAVQIQPTNIQPGQTINLRVNQAPVTGAGYITFPSTIKQVSGSNYVATGIAGAVDVVTFVSFDTGSLYLSAVKNFI